MIRIDDLEEAIAECEGQKNPNANTCLKLASLYTILYHKQGKQEARTEPAAAPSYSFAADQTETPIKYQSETDFGRLVNGMDAADVLETIDELMTTLEAIMPRLYDGVMIKLQK